MRARDGDKAEFQSGSTSGKVAAPSLLKRELSVSNDKGRRVVTLTGQA